MEKNQRNPRRRLNSLILLVAFTAVMLIVSTYAWFSAQRTVMIGNLEGKVNVAEGIEISLDGVSWSQEVDFTKYADTAAGVGQYKADLTKVYGNVNHNITPTELIPVSTTGATSITNTVTGGNEIAFYNGKNTDKVKLSEIVQAVPTQTSSAEKTFAGYYAIDLFIRDSSKLASGETQGTAMEALQLNTTSEARLVDTGSTASGLQNTLRVAFALYKPDLTNSDTQSVAYAETSQDKILAATTGANATILDYSIWEPNADQHVDEILKNNNRISWGNDDADLYLLTAVESKTGKDRLAVTTPTKGSEFLAGEMTPTYALTSSAVGATINDIYDWDGSESKLSKQIALQTKKSASGYTTVDGGVRNLISSKNSSGEAVYEWGVETQVTGGKPAETGAKEFKVYKNQISRLRMYVWLEGQDVDCTNYASHGGGVHIDIGLVKDAIPGLLAES